MWRNRKLGPEQLFAGWSPLGGVLISDPTAVMDLDREAVFGVGSDNGLWRIEEQSSDGPFGSWGAFGGVLSDGIVATTAFDGRVQVLGRGQDTMLWLIGQIYPGVWQ